MMIVLAVITFLLIVCVTLNKQVEPYLAEAVQEHREKAREKLRHALPYVLLSIVERLQTLNITADELALASENILLKIDGFTEALKDFIRVQVINNDGEDGLEKYRQTLIKQIEENTTTELQENNLYTELN